MPIPAQLLLVVAIVALGIAVFYASTGGIGPLVASAGRTFQQVAGALTSASTPAPSLAAVSDPPTIAPPDQPYTNQPTVDLHVSVPAVVIGKLGEKVRIYLGLAGQAPAPIEEKAIGATAEVVVQVDLTKGQNNFSATIVGPGGESELSPVVTLVLDQDPPKITLTSPKNNATVNGSTVKVTGKTQLGSTVVAHNQTNGTSLTTVAVDGGFTLIIALDAGRNSIQFVATDPAGNTSNSTITVFRGSGALTARLSASTYRLHAGQAQKLTLTVLVTDPNGRALPGAQVTFSLTIPGLSPVAADTVTNSRGQGFLTAQLPASITAGSGIAGVLVTTTAYGTATDQKAITVV